MEQTAFAANVINTTLAHGGLPVSILQGGAIALATASGDKVALQAAGQAFNSTTTTNANLLLSLLVDAAIVVQQPLNVVARPGPSPVGGISFSLVFETGVLAPGPHTFDVQASCSVADVTIGPAGITTGGLLATRTQV